MRVEKIKLSGKEHRAVGQRGRGDIYQGHQKQGIATPLMTNRGHHWKCQKKTQKKKIWKKSRRCKKKGGSENTSIGQELSTQTKPTSEAILGEAIVCKWK